MMEILSRILGMLFISFSSIYAMNKINSMKFNIKRTIFSLVIVTTTLIFNCYTPFPVTKPFVAVLTLVLVSRFILKLEMFNSLFGSIFFEFICIISENIIAIILMLFSDDNLIEWYNSPIGMIVLNFLISFLIIIIINLKITKQLYNKFLDFIKFMSHKSSLLIMISSFVSIVILFYVVYYHYYSNKLLVYITIVIIFAFYTFVIVAILKISSKYETIKNKYTLSIENLKSYEEMLDQYRISNHENKNQLLLIRNMIKDKKTKNYIDELIDNKEKDDSNVYNKLKRIPSSSIRAVIYSKVLLMNNKNINYSIDIDRKLSSKDFSNISSNLSLDICNILNIFIDNAIDEVGKSKNKQILIEFNKDSGNIEIAVSNTCDNDIKLNEIYGMGYSTKGDGHGYGLSLAKNILDRNSSKLFNKTEMVNDIFTQYLYVKTK